MEFLVRGAERIPSPCCGKDMLVIGTKNRKAIDHLGQGKMYNIRRLRCTNCCTIHHELPDFLVPYKRYELECIESVLTNPSNHIVPADNSTLSRWHGWFHKFVDYWVGCLTSIVIRTNQGNIPLDFTSAGSGTALQRIGRLAGDANGWLARIVRPIVNINLWAHTRSAFIVQ
ncbi:hypothetical protein BALCAV_0222250 [Alkalihalobacillus alcalophilus ATCC 27647 = CGMCC 1.3604]|uniref:DUF6431 domain-containing protein n=1 Tax=Alkalihalobacillus alcalophilus ATCC 27647 = CGMCC 1.3604 TaxID=1218173 RepID=A0A094X9P5_ALKAL|nr:hypothetical protein BALCAV_0222250 [Alkalihalobacillus alcalophilus ATCC 27647 = CGMCC 1.3604]